jgi:hypothetical protein
MTPTAMAPPSPMKLPESVSRKSVQKFKSPVERPGFLFHH